MEEKVSGSTDGGHRGLHGHELNSDFVLSNTHKQLETLHPWRHSEPRRTRPWHPDIPGPALSRDSV